MDSKAQWMLVFLPCACAKPGLCDCCRPASVRCRYNISTNDYDAWSETHNWTELNAKTKRPGQPTGIPIWVQLGMNKSEAEDRDFRFRQNPKVELYKDLDTLKLQLAINTNQFGRTFQDR